MQLPFVVLGGAFLTPQVEHTCLSGPPNAATANETTLITTTPEALTITHTNSTSMSTSNITTQESCVMPDGAVCSSWAFDTSTYGRTMTSEFQLVCDRQFLRPAYNSIYYFGSFFSCALAGWMSDRLGRKRMFSYGAVVFAILTNIISWLPNMTSVLAVRFLMGFCHPFCVQISYALVLEVFEEQWRAAAGILVFLPWTAGMMILSGVAHLTRDWRWTSFILSLPLLLLLPVLRVLDESPRWLIVRGRHEEALKVLQKAARWNNASLPPASDLRVLMKEIEHEASSRNRKQSGGVRASLRRFAAELTVLVRTRNMRNITLIAYCILIICSMCYIGLSLAGDIFSSNPYVYMALSGLMEIPGGTLTIPLVQRFGRRPCNIVLLFLTGASLLALTFVPNRHLLAGNAARSGGEAHALSLVPGGLPALQRALPYGGAHLGHGDQHHARQDWLYVCLLPSRQLAHSVGQCSLRRVRVRFDPRLRRHLPVAGNERRRPARHRRFPGGFRLPSQEECGGWARQGAGE